MFFKNKLECLLTGNIFSGLYCKSVTTVIWSTPYDRNLQS